jgi:hypothetical protein
MGNSPDPEYNFNARLRRAYESELWPPLLAVLPTTDCIVPQRIAKTQTLKSFASNYNSLNTSRKVRNPSSKISMYLADIASTRGPCPNSTQEVQTPQADILSQSGCSIIPVPRFSCVYFG